MEVQRLKLSKIKPNPANPRLIKDDKFNKLVQSLKDFPEMADIRPIVVNRDMVILGGNMRFKAMKEAGWKECPVVVAELTEEQEKEFIIKDNVGFGEWDFSMLANEWDAEQLGEWGVDIPQSLSEIIEQHDNYSRKVETPCYEATGEKPNVTELFDIEKYKKLVEEIENSPIQNDVKDFLKVAASRHIVFNYANIAEFYAQSAKDIQELMEKSALVIIDFDKAIEQGFIQLTEEIAEDYTKEYGEE